MNRENGMASLRPGLPPLLKKLGKAAARSLGGGLSRVLGPCGRGIGILTYHRIAPETGLHPAPTWNVAPERLRAQLSGLLARGYRPWSLRHVLARNHKHAAIPPGVFVVTFDDGYEGIYRHACPVLHELNIPATVFVATAYLDSVSPFPFDDWPLAGTDRAPVETWRPLTTVQCVAMLKSGLVEIGSHTHTHAIFGDRPDDLYQDLLASARILKDRFGLADATFAFPYGVAGPELATAARRAGMLCSLSTQEVLVRQGTDPFVWGRFGVEGTDTTATLAARLDGWYSLARGAWQQLSRREVR
jgi:peptidoglycan/xylan/chitin deacetylase (PgdA/CDA1 family)